MYVIFLFNSQLLFTFLFISSSELKNVKFPYRLEKEKPKSMFWAKCFSPLFSHLNFLGLSFLGNTAWVTMWIMKQMQTCSLATLSLCREIDQSSRKKNKDQRELEHIVNLSEKSNTNFRRLNCNVHSWRLSSDFVSKALLYCLLKTTLTEGQSRHCCFIFTKDC